jgi:hypothetical protein
VTYQCPADPSHQSDTDDYCSICGAKIDQASSTLGSPVATTSTSSAVSANACPDCGTERVGDTQYCELCRYDFVNKKSASPDAAAAFQPAVVQQPPDPAPATAAASTPTAPAAATGPRWEVLIRVDPNRNVEQDPAKQPPVGEPDRTLPLDLEENLIGRRNLKQGVRQQVPVNDPGVSTRHAKLIVDSQGGLALLDVGSTNGTQLNSQDVEMGVTTPLKDGDEIEIGYWTRIIIRQR